MISFRRFRTRVLVLVVGLVAFVQGVSYWAVAYANRRNAGHVIERNMKGGVRLFAEMMMERHRGQIAGAGLIGSDLALQYAIEQGDRNVMRRVLGHYVNQLNFAGMALMSGKGEILAAFPEPENEDALALLALLARQEVMTEDAPPAHALVDNEFLGVLVVPVNVERASGPPHEDIRLVITHRIDRELVERVERLSRLTLTLRPPSSAPSSPEEEPSHLLTRMYPMPLLNAPHATLVLQRSLDDELELVRWLEHLLAVTFGVSVTIAALLAIWLARSVSRPVQALARHTRVIATGDYATRIPWRRADELGDLAAALNTMSEGLAERDEVRDLLNKNVSPAVASRLLREGAVLRGEERVVTIMFVDLHGFTSLSERLAPAKLFNLLNRFFDVMSAEIEARGGIIDKYIGDEIMALFGAPLTMADAPARAVEAALAMRAALPALNAACLADGYPALDFGVGICTATVLAGNVGTHRRLNYSVIGDGVNQASRLQSLTRRKDWHASILINAATRAALGEPAFCRLRELGDVPLKGKAEPVRLYAVDGPVGPEAGPSG